MNTDESQVGFFLEKPNGEREGPYKKSDLILRRAQGSVRDDDLIEPADHSDSAIKAAACGWINLEELPPSRPQYGRPTSTPASPPANKTVAAPLTTISTLGETYRSLGIVTAILSAIALGGGTLTGNIAGIVTGAIGIIGAVLLFGFSEFFHQVARITAATEETARLLRERPLK